jgi:hypothetical protein
MFLLIGFDGLPLSCLRQLSTASSVGSIRLKSPVLRLMLSAPGPGPARHTGQWPHPLSQRQALRRRSGRPGCPPPAPISLQSQTTIYNCAMTNPASCPPLAAPARAWPARSGRQLACSSSRVVAAWSSARRQPGVARSPGGPVRSSWARPSRQACCGACGPEGSCMLPSVMGRIGSPSLAVRSTKNKQRTNSGDCDQFS